MNNHLSFSACKPTAAINVSATSKQTGVETRDLWWSVHSAVWENQRKPTARQLPCGVYALWAVRRLDTLKLGHAPSSDIAATFAGGNLHTTTIHSNDTPKRRKSKQRRNAAEHVISLMCKPWDRVASQTSVQCTGREVLDWWTVCVKFMEDIFQRLQASLGLKSREWQMVLLAECSIGRWFSWDCLFDFIWAS